MNIRKFKRILLFKMAKRLLTSKIIFFSISFLIFESTSFCLWGSSLEVCQKIIKKFSETSRKPPKIPLVPTEEWLEQNLLFGPEMTYSSEVLKDFDSGPRITSKDSTVKFENNAASRIKLAAWLKKYRFTKNSKIPDEVARFIFDGIDFVKGEGFLDGRNHSIRHQSRKFKIHTNNSVVKFILDLSDGSQLSVNLEPGAIEVNQAPAHFDELSNRWKVMDERIRAQGFVGTYDFASGGGGGHIHLGFKSRENNLFVLAPDMLFNLINKFIYYPSLFFFLREIGDYSSDSTSHSPFDIFSSTSAKDFSQDLKLFAKLSRGRQLRTVVPWKYSLKKDSILFSLADHDSFISLKRFATSQNPTLEVRFPRAFSEFDEMKLVAKILLKIIARAYQPTPKSDPLSVNEWTSSGLEKNLDILAKGLNLSKKETQSIRFYGNEDLLAPSPFKNKGEWKSAKIRPFQVSAEALPIYEFSVDVKELGVGENEISRVFVNGTNETLIIEHDPSGRARLHFRFYIYPSIQNEFLISLQKKDRTLINFGISATPDSKNKGWHTFRKTNVSWRKISDLNYFSRLFPNHMDFLELKSRIDFLKPMSILGDTFAVVLQLRSLGMSSNNILELLSFYETVPDRNFIIRSTTLNQSLKFVRFRTDKKETVVYPMRWLGSDYSNNYGLILNVDPRHFSLISRFLKGDSTILADQVEAP
ncbi:MAG: transglutaminase family protein [Deltaproteobacteria bacterium]|nr:transglutaminase family protein [Deltaproteobacteria bacterium]